MENNNNTELVHSSRERLTRGMESFLVLLNISTYCCVLPYILFHQYSRKWTIILIILINITYVFFRFRGKVRIPSDKLFFIFICINIANFLTVFLSDGHPMASILYPLLNISFYILLFNLYLKYSETESLWSSIWYIVRGYVWLGVMGVASAVLLFLMIKLGLNPLRTPIVNDYYDLFMANVVVLGHTYYYPYYISVLLVPESLLIKLPFFTDYGVICGIFHEPHVITFIVFPVLFILWAYTKSKLLNTFYFLIWMLIVFMELSTTNILAFGVSLLALFCVDRNKRAWLLPLGFIALYFFLYIGIENTDLFIVADKLGGDNTSSRDYTLGTIGFAFTPETLLGSDFMSNDYLFSYSSAGRRDVGYIQFFLNIVFLLLFIIRLIKVIMFSRKYRLIGIAILYFFVHSFKTAMVTYTSPQLLLMMFLLYVITNMSFDEDECLVKSSKK